MADKRQPLDGAISVIKSGMTVGIGGWGSRRKPMALVRALCRTDVKDLTIVSYGGPDVGLLCALGKVKKLIFGFVSLDSIPLEPHYRKARQAGALEVLELDEGMLQWGLYAAGLGLPFLPTRAGLGSDVMGAEELRTITSPYQDGETLVAMPALNLDVALIHANRADARGNARFTGPDPYFDDRYAMAAKHTIVSCEAVVPTAELSPGGAHDLHRMFTHAVVEAPGGAHFTSCDPDYGRDEAIQRLYVSAAKDEAAWSTFLQDFVMTEDYSGALAKWREST